MNNMMRVVLKRGLSWARRNLTEITRETGKFEAWGIVISIFEIDRTEIRLIQENQFTF